MMLRTSAPQADIEEGLRVEMEHLDSVDGDVEVLKRLVQDHLGEDPEYYRKLKRAGIERDNEQ